MISTQDNVRVFGRYRHVTEVPNLTEIQRKAYADFLMVEVPQGNVSTSYPGVYSLWLKRAENGWHLVFNHQGDVWGTMYDATTDLAEIALEHGTAQEPAEKLTLKLEESGEGGTLELAWGEHRWIANFSAAQ